MPTPIPLEELMSAWTARPLSQGWSAVVRHVVAELLISQQGSAPPNATAEPPPAAGIAVAKAWAELGTLFGDSGAPELCSVVMLHALSLVSESDDADAASHTAHRLRASLHLALADLGLAAASTPDPIPLLDVEARLVPEKSRVDPWLAGFLAPVDGDLQRGAKLALRLAAIRAGLLERPSPLTVAAVEALRLVSVPTGLE